MIETIVRNYLSGNLNGIDVVLEEPEKAPVKYVLIEKTGSGESNKIKSATIAIQAYAASLYEAAELNETVKDLMEDLAALDEVSHCSLNSDYNYTDTTTRRYRYQAVFNITYY